ncbi:Clp protease N-terminal domain-containing protein [Streptomyces sp. NBC_01304]|uniref:Clp protease N-terminal domain-containing protein n=1 Tax=Streptomyces sp. NBC_01304 TaxID=2903818 RepID=UPI002E1606A6|nr:peptidase [Streptomyces sp. NBC_01304]
MFERFTQGAREVVEGAVAHAERQESGAVTDEHVLLALLDARGSKAAFVLSALGADAQKDALVRELAEVRRRGGVSEADAEALAGLGIDVGQIVARVEEAHGAGALAGDRRDRRWWGGKHRSFSREAKDTLEKSLRIAVGRKDRFIGDEHLLLALASRPGVVRDVLGSHGVSVEAVEQVLGGSGAGGVAQAG